MTILTVLWLLAVTPHTGITTAPSGKPHSGKPGIRGFLPPKIRYLVLLCGEYAFRCQYGRMISWEQRKLGELVQFSKGTGYSKADLRTIGTPIILYGRLYTKYETVISDVDTFAEARQGSVYSSGGEVIVPASGETAEDISIASVVEKSGVLLGGDLNIINPAANLDPAFLAISISNGKPHSDMAKMAQGKSVVHLHNTDLGKIELAFPSFAEQRHISDYYRCLDHLITLHQC